MRERNICAKKEREEKHKARERKYLMDKTGCFSVDNERKKKLVKWETAREKKQERERRERDTYRHIIW